MLLTAFKITTNMAIMMAMGFALRRFGIINGSFSKQLSNMMYYLVIPCIIIDSMNSRLSIDVLKNGAVMLVLGVLMAACMLAFGQIIYWLSGKSGTGRLMRFGMLYTSYTILGFALVPGLYGSESVFYFSIFLIPLRIIAYSMVEPLLRAPVEKAKIRPSLSVFRSPMLISTLIGLAIYITPVTLPDTIGKVISSVGGTCSVLGAIICGILLSEARIREYLHSLHIYLFLLLKLVAAPAIMTGILFLLGIHGITAQMTIMCSALPIAVTISTFTLRFEGESEISSVDTAVQLAVSVITIPIVVTLTQNF